MGAEQPTESFEAGSQLGLDPVQENSLVDALLQTHPDLADKLNDPSSKNVLQNYVNAHKDVGGDFDNWEDWVRTIDQVDRDSNAPQAATKEAKATEKKGKKLIKKFADKFPELKDMDINKDEVLDENEKQVLAQKVEKLVEKVEKSSPKKRKELFNAVSEEIGKYQGITANEVGEWIYGKENYKFLSASTFAVEAGNQFNDLLQKEYKKRTDVTYWEFIKPSNLFGLSGYLPGMEGESFMEKEQLELESLIDDQREAQFTLKNAIGRIEKGEDVAVVIKKLPKNAEGNFLKSSFEGKDPKETLANYYLQKGTEIKSSGVSDIVQGIACLFLEKAAGSDISEVSEKAKGMLPKGFAEFRQKHLIAFADNWLSYDKLLLYAGAAFAAPIVLKAVAAKAAPAVAAASSSSALLKGGAGGIIVMNAIACGGTEDEAKAAQERMGPTIEEGEEVIEEEPEAPVLSIEETSKTITEGTESFSITANVENDFDSFLIKKGDNEISIDDFTSHEDGLHFIAPNLGEGNYEISVIKYGETGEEDLESDKVTVTVAIEVAEAPPEISNLQIDFSETWNMCLSGGSSYPIIFNVENATSGVATVEVISGSGSPGSTSEVIIDENTGTFNYISGSDGGDTIRITVECEGPGGKTQQHIDITLQ
jgi:hypothetical protein